MKLLELSQEYASILEEIESSGGELNETLESRLDTISRELAQSADKSDFILKKLAVEADFYAARIKELQAYKKAIEGAAERFKSQLKAFMHAAGTTRLEGEYVDLVLKAGKPKVVIDAEGSLPEGYFETTIVRTPDKGRMYEDMKMGVPVAGAHLEDSFALATTRRKTK